VRGRGRRAVAIGECGFNGYRYDVKNEGGEGESVRRCLMRGIEEVRMVLRFLYCGAREGVPWQSAVWWCRPGQRQLRRPRWETSWGAVVWAASASGSDALVGQRGKIKKMGQVGYQGYWAETGLGHDEK
jgi:hypothetical protein